MYLVARSKCSAPSDPRGVSPIVSHRSLNWDRPARLIADIGACEKNDRRDIERYVGICIRTRILQPKTQVPIYRYVPRRSFFSHAPVLILSLAACLRSFVRARHVYSFYYHTYLRGIICWSTQETNTVLQCALSNGDKALHVQPLRKSMRTTCRHTSSETPRQYLSNT